MGAHVCLADAVTAIITTSPAPSHPSTELIKGVLDSIAKHAPSLASCRTIIVCDGIKQVPESGKVNFRAAKVDQAGAQAYSGFKTALRKDAVSAEILELEQNHGFGYAVRAALQMVTTPLVCVLQHDRVLLRDCDTNLRNVAQRMLARDLTPEVGYCLLPTRTALPHEYAHKCRIRLGERGIRPPRSDIEPHAIALADGLRLLPLLTWFDSTHLCSLRHYADVILPACTKGAFIESEVGPLQLAEAEAEDGGVGAMLSRWKCYLLDDGHSAPVVGHLNGAVRLASGLASGRGTV